MKHNIIGDIHGRTNWKELIDLSAINVFIGDYWDPYEFETINQSFDALKTNFLNIIALKKSHPRQVILLYGNHDFHYIYPGNRSSRYDAVHAGEIRRLFIESEKYFHGICYTFGNVVVTHAGITREWYEHLFGKYDPAAPLSSIEDKLNALWRSPRAEAAFRFSDMADSDDFEGTSPHHSPIWVRLETLVIHNLFGRSSVMQIVGHTQYPGEKAMMRTSNIVCVDVLGYLTESFKI